jgi:acyl carrier protein
VGWLCGENLIICLGISFLQKNIIYMSLQEFVKNFEDQFDDVEPNSMEPDTVFREVEEWSSLTALSIIAMVDAEYGVALSGDDIKNSNTIQDVFEIVGSKK